MMKKISSFILINIAMLFTVGCSDFLDFDPLGELGELGELRELRELKGELKNSADNKKKVELSTRNVTFKIEVKGRSYYYTEAYSSAYTVYRGSKIKQNVDKVVRLEYQSDFSSIHEMGVFQKNDNVTFTFGGLSRRNSYFYWHSSNARLYIYIDGLQAAVHDYHSYSGQDNRTITFVIP